MLRFNLRSRYQQLALLQVAVWLGRQGFQNPESKSVHCLAIAGAADHTLFAKYVWIWFENIRVLWFTTQQFWHRHSRGMCALGVSFFLTKQINGDNNNIIWGKTFFLNFFVARDQFWLLIKLFLGSRNYLISRPNIRYPSHSARQQLVVVAPQCSPWSQDNRLQKLWDGRLNKTDPCPTDALLTPHRVELPRVFLESGALHRFSWIPVWFLAQPISFLRTGGSCSALGQKTCF